MAHACSRQSLDLRRRPQEALWRQRQRARLPERSACCSATATERSATPVATYASGGESRRALLRRSIWNRDGKPDLLVTNGACFQCRGTTTAVLIGTGDGSDQPPVRYHNGASAIEPAAVAAGDVDGDGLADAVVVGLCGAGGDCCRNAIRSAGAVATALCIGAAVYNWSGGGVVSPNTVILADLNNDGKPDVVVGGITSLGVFLNQTPRARTTTTLLSQTNPAALGQSVTFTATVSSSSPGTPTGTVTFSDGVTPLGSAPLVGGIATFNTSSLALGAHTIHASYSSDSGLSRERLRAADAACQARATTTPQFSRAAESVDRRAGGDVHGHGHGDDGRRGRWQHNLQKMAARFSGPWPFPGTARRSGTSSLLTGAHDLTAVYGGDASHAGSLLRRP